MTNLSTTWTDQSYVAFNQSTISTTANLITQVETNINRGTLSASSHPTSTQVTNWLIRGKQKLMEAYGFTWKRKFSYCSSAAGTYRYALPADFAGGATILRDLTQDIRLSFMDPITFDTVYPDVSGSSNAVPEFYTIKDRELWLATPADGTYTFELEYLRTGEDSTAETWDYIPERMLFQITDYATYRAFMMLQMWDAATAYKSEFNFDKNESRKDDGKKKWAQMNYQCLNWHNVK